MEKKKKRKMCSIFGCTSSTLDNPDMMFFSFPSPKSPDYQTWMSACKDSYKQLSIIKNPFVCELHFEPNDYYVSHRQLKLGSIPTLRLSPPKDVIFAQQAKQKIKFLNKVMHEWLLRNRPHRDIYGRDLVANAKKAAIHLDIPTFNLCWVTWLQDFNEEITAPMSKCLKKANSSDLPLEIADIIGELSQQEQDFTAVLNDKVTVNSVDISNGDEFNDTRSYAELPSKHEVKEKNEDADFALKQEVKEEKEDADLCSDYEVYIEVKEENEDADLCPKDEVSIAIKEENENADMCLMDEAYIQVKEENVDADLCSDYEIYIEVKEENEDADLCCKDEVSIAVKKENEDADLSSVFLHDVPVTVKEENEDCYESSTKIPKLELMLSHLEKEDATTMKKKNINTYNDALKYMKTLEEFALQKGNFRAIRLLTELEDILNQGQ